MIIGTFGKINMLKVVILEGTTPPPPEILNASTLLRNDPEYIGYSHKFNIVKKVD